jgi:hypothetical protein
MKYRASTGCGVEREVVKTMSDPDAAKVDPTPIETTITALSTPGELDHCQVGNEARGVGAEEFRTYSVKGTITVAKLEADHDVHLAIAEMTTTEATMIVEVVDPACAPRSLIYPELTSARSQLRALLGLPLTSQNLKRLVGKRVQIIGVGFFDRAHNQSGMAPSCQELHPVRSILATQ